MTDKPMDTLEKEVLETSGPRAAFCRFLAGLFLYEPTQEQVDAMAAADLPCDDTEIGRGYALIAEYLRHRDSGTRQQIAVDYAHTFLGAGSYEKITAPPYESVFTSEERLLMQDARDAVLVWYRGEGLDLPSENTTPEDHAGFELQFMATLIERAQQAAEEGDEARLAELVDKQAGYYREHMANWLPALAKAIDDNCETDFYHGFACLVRGLVEEEGETVAGQKALLG